MKPGAVLAWLVVVAAAAVYFIAPPPGFDARMMHAAAVVVLAVGLWALNVFPEYITGLVFLVTAMLLASFAGHYGTRLDRRIPALTFGAVVAVAAFGAWQYLGAGHPPFGGANHIDDLVGTAPVLVGFALAGIALVGLAYRWCTPAARAALRPLLLFGAPLAIAPMIGQAAAPTGYPCAPRAFRELREIQYLPSSSGRQRCLHPHRRPST